MTYRQAVLAAVLTALGSSAWGQLHIIVESEDACPAGTVPRVPAYNWKDGRFVLDGWVCESLHNPRN